MFGIGLPEIVVIFGVALIVVGPEKLPELAKSIAKGLNELKKTASALKESLNEETKELGIGDQVTTPEQYPVKGIDMPVEGGADNDGSMVEAAEIGGVPDVEPEPEKADDKEPAEK